MTLSRTQIVAMVVRAADPSRRVYAERAGHCLADLIEAGVTVPPDLLRGIVTAPPPTPAREENLHSGRAQRRYSSGRE